MLPGCQDRVAKSSRVGQWFSDFLCLLVYMIRSQGELWAFLCSKEQSDWLFSWNDQLSAAIREKIPPAELCYHRSGMKSNVVFLGTEMFEMLSFEKKSKVQLKRLTAAFEKKP